MLPRLVALACCLSLMACARTSQVSTRFMGATEAEPPAALLLVARMPETEQRRRWEQACMTQLYGGEALTLIASTEALPNWYEGGNEQLLAWARDKGNAVNVLVFELTGLLLAPFSMPPGNVVSSERFPNEDPIGDPTWAINLGRSPEKPPELPETIETEVRLISGAGDVLWEGLVYTHEANDLAAIGRSQCAAVQETLEGLGHLPDRKGLLPFISGR